MMRTLQRAIRRDDLLAQIPRCVHEHILGYFLSSKREAKMLLCTATDVWSPSMLSDENHSTG